MSEQERFDGFPVTLYDGKFQGGFDLEDEGADDIRYDDVVTFVVTARVGGVQFSETKLGDVKRTNVFKVTSSTALEKDMAEKVLNTLGVSVNGVNAGQMSLTAPSSNGSTAGSASFELEDDDEDGPGDAPAGAPVSDPVLARFLADG